MLMTHRLFDSMGGLRSDTKLMAPPAFSAVGAAAAARRRQPVRADHALRITAAASASGLLAATIGGSPSSPTMATQRRQPRRPLGIVTNPRVRPRASSATAAAAVAAAVAASAKASQTSHLNPPQTPTTPVASTAPRGRRWRTPTGWASEKLARLRRSLSTSAASAPPPSATEEDASSAEEASTAPPRRSSVRLRRRRQVSLQRLVQRLAQSPAGWAAAARRPRGTSGCGGCGGCGVRVLRLHPDGSRTLRLSRPPCAKFGFFLARDPAGVAYVSRFVDAGAQSWYGGQLSVGDAVLLISGLRTDAVTLEAIGAHIADKDALEVRVRSGCGV